MMIPDQLQSVRHKALFLYHNRHRFSRLLRSKHHKDSLHLYSRFLLLRENKRMTVSIF